MTYSPTKLRDLMALYTSHGGENLGIVGDTAHLSVPSYHNGKDVIERFGRTGATDYSIRLPRDINGLTDAASAVDLGPIHGSLGELRKFSEWFVATLSKADLSKAPWADVREVIYWSAANQRVQRWNFDNVIRWGAGQGDGSHQWHTHVSFFRDSENRDKTALFAPYFADTPDVPGSTTVQQFSAYTAPHVCDAPKGETLFTNEACKADGKEIIIGDPAPRTMPYLGTLPGSKVGVVVYSAPEDATPKDGKTYFVKIKNADGTARPIFASRRPLVAPSPDVNAALDKAADAAADAVRKLKEAA